jgi:hypothetical protein
MSRLADAILTGQFTAGYSAPMLDLRNGGQMGYAPNLAAFASNAAYVQRNLVCLLMEAPLGFQFMPDPDFMVGALKALLETHPKTITGMNATVTVDFSAENAVSGGGEMQQDFTDIKRQRSEPQFVFVEKYGRPIQTFLYEWITNLIGDPDTKVPNIATLAGNKPTDLLPDMYTCTCLFFEPDPTFSTVVKAWLTTNMAPKGTGDITGKRDLASAMESSDLTIDFTGISQSSLGVRQFAQSILDNINLTNANPNLAPAFLQGIEADVAAANTGYVAGAEALGNSAIASRG